MILNNMKQFQCFRQKLCANTFIINNTKKYNIWSYQMSDDIAESFSLTIEDEQAISSALSLSSQSVVSTSPMVVDARQTSLILGENDILKLDDYIKHLASIANDQAIANNGISANESGNIVSFTKGFLLGQFSVIIVLVAFIRFFVFSESVPKNSPGGKKKRLITNDTILNGNEFAIAAVAAAAASASKKATGSAIVNESQITSNDPSSPKDPNDGSLINDEDNLAIVNTINTILEKTYYNVNTHQTESLDWFNVLVAQIITQFRTEALYENNILDSLNEFLSSSNEDSKIPDWLDTIKINEINIGNDFPIFSNCRITKNNLGKLEAKIDVDLSDTLTLAIETKILINKPKILTAALPIKLSVSIIRFSGCLNISLDSIPVSEDSNDINEDNSKAVDTDHNSDGNSNDNNSSNNDADADISNNTNDDDDDSKTTDNIGGPGGSSKTAGTDNMSYNDKRPLKFKGVLNFGFSSDYRLEFKTKSLIGSRSKLENVPKISSLIESQLKSWFVERCVEPRFQSIPLPNMWPRKKNVRANI